MTVWQRGAARLGVIAATLAAYAVMGITGWLR